MIFAYAIIAVARNEATFILNVKRSGSAIPDLFYSYILRGGLILLVLALS